MRTNRGINKATENDARHAFEDLDAWISGNGWAGYDPYDIQGQEWFVRILGGYSAVERKLRALIRKGEKALPPYALRRLLRVEKTVNAKGMGLLAAAYLVRFESDGDPGPLRKAEAILEWLGDNYSRQYPGRSWGYPFHWLSRVPIPRYTPSVVVTSVVGDAWLKHYELTKTEESLQVGEEIATFILEGLNQTKDGNGGVCFSYTPLDNFKVHNANLFAAQFLARLSTHTRNTEYKELAVQAVQYTLREQNRDGSFCYWSGEPDSVIDHYHTGFVLRHLDVVCESLDAKWIKEPLIRGFRFYLEHLFDDEGIPKHTVDRRYPIDIHSCAEALLCITRLGPRYGGLHLLPTVLDFTLTRMRNNEGWFIARIDKVRNGERRVEIPYMRWGQAWMLLGLSEIIHGGAN